MATASTLQKVINATKPYLRNQPLDFSNMEPALEAGNIVLQTLLGAPLAWPFNRNTFSFALRPGTPDYRATLTDFAYLETQWISDSQGNIFELGSANKLPMPTTAGAARPSKIALQRDDSQGNLIFRMDKMPAATPFTVAGDYQCSAPVLTSLATSLAPWPDNLRYVFDWGFLTIMGMLVNDARIAFWERMFIGRVLSLQDGLSDEDIDLFMGTWQARTRTMMRTQTGTQAALAGRQV